MRQRPRCSFTKSQNELRVHVARQKARLGCASKSAVPTIANSSIDSPENLLSWKNSSRQTQSRFIFESVATRHLHSRQCRRGGYFRGISLYAKSLTHRRINEYLAAEVLKQSR